MEIYSFYAKQLISQGSTVNGTDFTNYLPNILNIIAKRIGPFLLADFINKALLNQSKKNTPLSIFLYNIL